MNRSLAISGHGLSAHWDVIVKTVSSRKPNTSRDVTMLFRRNTAAQEFEAEALPHLNDLYRTATRLTGNQNDAEDLMQEVYLQAWKSFDRYQRGTNCRAWLFTIMFNKLQHYRRSKATNRVFTLADADNDLLENTPGEPSSPDIISDEEVLAALERIPDDYHAVVLLADVQDFAYREIAGILDIPIGTVMSRLSRGRRLLRGMLAECARMYGVRNAKQAGE